MARARQEARAREVTLRELVVDGLHAVIETGGGGEGFRYEPVVFDGERGIAPGVDLANWDAIRGLAYELGE